MFLSIVMPVYNEEYCIQESMRRVDAFMRLKNWDWELLVVSDGSRDRTNEIVSAYSKLTPNVKLLGSETNMGKGAAVRKGVLASGGDFVLVTDADLAAPIKEVDKLLRALDDGYDAAIGSRALREQGCDVQQSFKRTLSGRVFNLIVRTVLLKDFFDTQCGFKCLKKEAAKRVFSEQKLDGFCFDVEILYLALKRGFKVKEVPVMWRAAPQSKVRLFRDSFKMIGELFRLRRT